MALSRVRILSLGYLKIHSLSHRPVRLEGKIYHYCTDHVMTAQDYAQYSRATNSMSRFLDRTRRALAQRSRVMLTFAATS